MPEEEKIEQLWLHSEKLALGALVMIGGNVGLFFQKTKRVMKRPFLFCLLKNNYNK